MTILRRLGLELRDYWRTAVTVHELAARSAFRGPVADGQTPSRAATSIRNAGTSIGVSSPVTTDCCSA